MKITKRKVLVAFCIVVTLAIAAIIAIQIHNHIIQQREENALLEEQRRLLSAATRFAGFPYGLQIPIGYCAIEVTMATQTAVINLWGLQEHPTTKHLSRDELLAALADNRAHPGRTLNDPNRYINPYHRFVRDFVTNTRYDSNHVAFRIELRRIYAYHFDTISDKFRYLHPYLNIHHSIDILPLPVLEEVIRLRGESG